MIPLYPGSAHPHESAVFSLVLVELSDFSTFLKRLGRLLGVSGIPPGTMDLLFS